jgi:hypothetical protein
MSRQRNDFDVRRDQSVTPRRGPTAIEFGDLGGIMTELNITKSSLQKGSGVSRVTINKIIEGGTASRLTVFRLVHYIRKRYRYRGETALIRYGSAGLPLGDQLFIRENDKAYWISKLQQNVSIIEEFLSVLNHEILDEEQLNILNVLSLRLENCRKSIFQFG